MDGLDTAKYTYDALQKKYANFLSPAVEITIGSKTYTNKELPILNLEVEIAADGSAGGCTFTVDSEYKSEDTPWIHDFDEVVQVGEKLIIKGGYIEKKEIFYGYVDDYTFSYSGDEGQRIDITGIDGLGYLMSMREPIYAGKKKPDAIVQSIFEKSIQKGFAQSMQVGEMKGFDTPVVKEQVDDWTFLNLVAARYGMTLFAVDGELILDDVVSNDTPIITLSRGINLRSFTKRVSLAHQVGQVEIWGRDVNQKPIKGVADSVKAGPSSTKTKSAAQLVPAFKTAVLREYSEFVRTQAECVKLAQSRLDGIAMGLVSGEGRCIGIPEIIPGRYIEIAGLDDRANGKYFISRVKHTFTKDGYATTFEVKGAKTI